MIVKLFNFVLIIVTGSWTLGCEMKDLMAQAYVIHG
jgi:hypothetical protein